MMAICEDHIHSHTFSMKRSVAFSVMCMDMNAPMQSALGPFVVMVDVDVEQSSTCKSEPSKPPIRV